MTFWLINLALIACCLLAGYLMVMQVRFWGASVLITTVFYAWVTGFFFPLYNILIYNTTSLAGILNSFAILAKHPSFLFNIMWFNMAIPFFFIIGSLLVIKSILAQRTIEL